MKRSSLLVSLQTSVLAVVLTACGSSGSGPAGHTIGGTINITSFDDHGGGLSSYTLVLQNNDGDELSIPINSTDSGGTKIFQFATPVADGGSYNVTVLHPTFSDIGDATIYSYNFCFIHEGQGTGTNLTSDVNVEITCQMADG